MIVAVFCFAIAACTGYAHAYRFAAKFESLQLFAGDQDVGVSSLGKRARDQDRELCPHCDQNLSVKTFKKHKTLFLKSDGTWIKSYSDMEAADSDIASKNINTYSTQ